MVYMSIYSQLPRWGCLGWDRTGQDRTGPLGWVISTSAQVRMCSLPPDLPFPFFP